MTEVRKVQKSEIANRFSILQPSKSAMVSASGINTRIEEKQLQGVTNRKGLTYSHTWLINVDAIPMEYMPCVLALFKENPDGVEYKQLNGFNLVIKARVNFGEDEPSLPMRGEEVKVLCDYIVSKEGEVLTHEKNIWLKDKPLYTVRDYRLQETSKSQTIAEIIAQMEERSQLPVDKTTEPAPTTKTTEPAPTPKATEENPF